MEMILPMGVQAKSFSPIFSGVFSGEYLPSASASGRSPVWNSQMRSSWSTFSGVIWVSGEYFVP